MDILLMLLLLFNFFTLVYIHLHNLTDDTATSTGRYTLSSSQSLISTTIQQIVTAILRKLLYFYQRYNTSKKSTAYRLFNQASTDLDIAEYRIKIINKMNVNFIHVHRRQDYY